MIWEQLSLELLQRYGWDFMMSPYEQLTTIKQ